IVKSIELVEFREAMVRTLTKESFKSFPCFVKGFVGFLEKIGDFVSEEVPCLTNLELHRLEKKEKEKALSKCSELRDV
ncbi:hypothetical protein Tco_0329916, partial [Tanacetum coccineum]